MLLAIPLATVTARTDLGSALRTIRLLLIPEERDPPKILARANEPANILQNDCRPLGELLRHNRALQHAHLNMLAPTPPRRRGDIDLALATAKAKMAEFETLQETLEALTPNEKRALLSDPPGFRRLLAMSAI